MSIHIAAPQAAGAVAETVLLPGDPRRAEFIAKTFLENAECYTDIRNMLGFTGSYKGKKISVQGTGMGIPSISIYVNELFRDYGVQRAIRIGTAGALQKEVRVRDVVLALAASTDSAVNQGRFNGQTYAPHADFGLLKTAFDLARQKNIPVKTGAVFTTDRFYGDDPEGWKLWAGYGVLAVEMETVELYTLAAKYRREALSILTISDSLVTHEETTSAEREQAFTRMIELALETAIS